MAPSSPQKRKSVAVVTGAAKRQRQCKLVEEALLTADKFPMRVREMVSGNLAECLGVPKEERHPTQEKVIGMVGEMMRSVQEGYEKSIETAESKLGSATEAKASREKDHEDAAAAVTAKTEAVAAAKAATNDSVQAIKAAKAALATAETEQAEGDKDLVLAAEKKEKLEAVLSNAYTPLKEGNVLLDAQKKTIASVVGLGKDFQLDSSMLTSLPSALAKAPADRGSFDAMVFDTLGDELTKRIKALDDTLASGEPAKAERAAKVEAAKNDLDAKQTESEKLKADLETCKADLETAKADHKTAANALQQFWPEMKQVEKDSATAKAKIEAFTEGPLASYEEMMNFTNLPPAPAPAAAAAAEASAAA